jgi:hypothetical protein
MPMSIHQQIASFAHDVAQQINQTMERDCLNLINKEGYSKEQLELCFYRHEPLRYSIRVGDKIIIDRWLHIEYIYQGKEYP